MKLIILLTVSYVALAMPDRSMLVKQWQEFKETYGKSYSPNEEPKRFAIFLKNTEFIDNHNHLYNIGKVSYNLKINEFSDWFEDEINQLMSPYLDQEEDKSEDEYDEEDDSSEEDHKKAIPKLFDWRDKGAITGVKSQKSCGSCWAFATTGSVEAHHYIKHQKRSELSEQNLMDCASKSGGCRGGSVHAAYNYIIKNGGIDKEKNYPYEAKPNHCRFSNKTIGAKLKGFKKLPKSEDSLKNTIATVGPVAVSLNSHLPTFHHYHSGVYYDPECDKHGVTHAMVVVGYGIQNGTEYFLLKNSWGKNWGDHGYIKIAATKKGHCKLTSNMVYPIVV